MKGTQRATWLWDEVQAVLAAELAREAEALCCGDLREIEARLQPLRRVGGALLCGLARLRLADLAGTAPACPRCAGAVRLVEHRRPRRLRGLVGDRTLQRPYYHCGACKAGVAPPDEA
jgi:hypothetical protein